MTRPAPLNTPPFYDVEQRRTLVISLLAIIVAAGAVGVARLMVLTISLIGRIGYGGNFDIIAGHPTGRMQPWMILVPVVGALVVGLMARFGTGAIRGDGIPEAMEQILTNESKISPSVTFLKPLSAAIVIGSGGPFGAEGPIIATGGALGSLVGQLLHTTPDERKTLLAAGAAAGITAIFGTPVSAVLMAIEILLFEYRPRSLVPVALASAAAMGLRMTYESGAGVFAMPQLTQQPSGEALTAYVVLGAIVGVASVIITRGLYWIEEGFEKLPVHWMWWPALGAIVTGVIGYFEPRTLGVGYDNIRQILAGHILGYALLALVLLKLVSWSIALGSGTSGGTLAPLFTIGGGLGGILGMLCVQWFPGLGVDPRIAALVGMAAVFAGASRALLTSVVFAFETTLQPIGLLPLLGGCTAAFLISSLMMRYTIMTEKLARRGTFVPTEYIAAQPDEIRRHDARAVRERYLEFPLDLTLRRRRERAVAEKQRTTELL